MNKHTEKLEKLEKVGNLYRITENYMVSTSEITTINHPLTESKILVEGKEYNVDKSYRFKIWNKDPSERGFNANNRNYCHAVDVALKQNPTTLAMADHPEDGKESVRNICGIEKNCQLDSDNWMSYEFFPVGEMGRTIEEIIEKGGFIEMSSSILGELDENGYVLPESVVIERLGDWVWNCSNRLLQSKSAISMKDDSGVSTTISEEGVEKDVEVIEEKKSDSVNSLRKNNALLENKNIGEMDMSEKLVEQSLQLNVKALIRDANKTDSLYEKKELLESAHTYAESLEDKKLFEETSKLLEGINSELQVLSEKGMETDDLKKTVEELTADKEKLEKELAELKDEKEKVEEQVKTISEMYESKQYEASEDELLKNRRLSKEVCGLKLRVRNQERELVSMKKRNKSLKEKCVRLEASANSKVEADKYVLLEQENQKLANRNSNLSKSVQSMRESSLRNNRPQRSVDRFDRMRDSIKENRLPKKEEVKIVESTSINEDDIMEKMLGN